MAGGGELGLGQGMFLFLIVMQPRNFGKSYLLI